MPSLGWNRFRFKGIFWDWEIWDWEFLGIGNFNLISCEKNNEKKIKYNNNVIRKKYLHYVRPLLKIRR